MANEKELINKLFKIAQNQQKIITKLAQTLPNTLQPGSPTKTEALAILNALPAQVRSAVDALEVHPGPDANEVKVRFVAGKSSPQLFNAIQRIVQDLQTKNVLGGQSYKITEVA